MEKPSLQTDKEGKTRAAYIENLSDSDLEVLNKLLPWNCFTLDTNGRRLGNKAWDGKRDTPQFIPDPRIDLLNQLYPLEGRSALEVGCFEGIHTLGLASYGANVIAVDSRIENVAKTIIRTWSHGFFVKSFKCNVEDNGDWSLIPDVDIAHHVGVLYHLKDPVNHLHDLCNKVKSVIMLDTHISSEADANLSYYTRGIEYKYKRYNEGGRDDAFSGMYDHSKWLTIETLSSILRNCGFSNVNIVEIREERNGPRVLLFANR